MRITDLTTIPYSPLCTTTMNMEVIEPTLVMLIDTWTLLYFVRFTIRNFSLKCSIFRFIHFCCCVVISNKKAFLGRVLLISLFAKRQLQLITQGMTYAINAFIYLAIMLLNIAIENYKRMKHIGTVRSA